MAESPAPLPVGSPARRPVWARRRLFSLRRRQITAIDVDGQVLRVVQTTHSGGTTKVTRFAAEPLDLAADADRADPLALGNAIAKALRNLKLRPGLVVMGVPRAKVVLRTLSLPMAESRGEIASMVHFQVAKDLPYRLDEAVVDFKVHGPILPAAADAKSEKPAPDRKTEGPNPEVKMAVLVAAAKHDVVEYYHQVADAAGLKLTALGLRSYANARCVEACQVLERGENVALISLRPDEVIIDLLVEQSLMFSRVASVSHPEVNPETAPAPPPPLVDSPAAEPREAPTGEEAFAQAVTIEVVRSLHSYEGTMQYGKVSRVVVTGGTGNEPVVVAALEKRLGLPCTLLDPAVALGLPESKRVHATGAVVAFGLGLGINDPEGLPFDFLHPKRPTPPRNWRRIRVMVGAALGALLLCSLAGVRAHLVKQRLAVKNELAAQVATEEKKRPIYRQLRLQARAVEDWMSEDHSWLDHYAYLSSILPPSEELYVTSLSSGSRDSLRLSVQARSGEVIAKLDRLLRAAGYEVKPLAITPAADRHGYPFRSTVELVVSARMKIDLANNSATLLPANGAPPPAGTSKPLPPGTPRKKGGG